MTKQQQDESTKLEEGLHVYRVGMGSDVRMVAAPSAKAAALFYGIRGINTNNPLMVAVYEKDGREYKGNAMPWGHLAFGGDEAAALAELDAIKADYDRCQFLPEMNGVTMGHIKSVIDGIAKEAGIPKEDAMNQQTLDSEGKPS